MNFEKISGETVSDLEEFSAFASGIVKEYFDSIIGSAQNDYMIKLFQSPEAIFEQLNHGYQYYYVMNQGIPIGFLAFYRKSQQEFYLSKFYLQKEARGKGYSREMMDFVRKVAIKAGCSRISLNVNRNNSARYVYEHLGFQIARAEKNDIGHGFFMDDYVYELSVE